MALCALQTAAQREAAIGEADIIVVSGGNTLFAVTRWRRLGVDLLLKQAMERGAVLCGEDVSPPHTTGFNATPYSPQSCHHPGGILPTCTDCL